jgi:exodeoxyribonuclease VII large subunit
MAHIFSVHELTQAVKATLEGEFPMVWVRGQISNLARPGSGHVYFTLKDGQACLAAVWFKSQQRQAGHGRAAALADGQEVICFGRLTVYVPRGAYQLVVEMVQDQGLGALYMAFEALKKKLAGQGYFEPTRKRPLPAHPRRVAVLTATRGAALRDFLRLAGERGCGASIRIHPVLVQGKEAPGQLVQALHEVNAQGWAEVAVLIRGGGSLEDLWAFNNEQLARAVLHSDIPVLTGIGHEVDTSIADLVADVRAATPSHAAQMLWPERRELTQMVDELENRLHRAGARLLSRAGQAVNEQEKALSWLSPRTRVVRALERLNDLRRDLARQGQHLSRQRQGSLEQARAGLIRSMDSRYWAAMQTQLEHSIRDMHAAAHTAQRQRGQRLESLHAVLAGLDPVRPLEKGFCLVQTAPHGPYLRSAAEAIPGKPIFITPRTGRITATVLEVTPENGDQVHARK